MWYNLWLILCRNDIEIIFDIGMHKLVKEYYIDINKHQILIDFKAYCSLKAGFKQYIELKLIQK